MNRSVIVFGPQGCGKTTRDNAGGCAEDWLWGSDIRKEEKVAELEQLVGDWIQANEPPEFYMVEDVEALARSAAGAA